MFLYSITFQILNNLFEIMNGVGEIINPYLLNQYSDLHIFSFQNNLDRVN